MSTPRMFGIETEFAFAAFSRSGGRVDSIGAMQRLMDIARRRIPCLPGRGSSGLFLANGSRLYIDCKKPEFTTPEVTNPWDAARYGLACERMLSDITSQYVQEAADVSDAVVSNVNVSYGNWASTWASHESYAHRSDPSIFPEHLIPHLCSRLIFTGAGGFDNRSTGVEFLISPRVAHLVREISGDSTSNRGIFHTKNEALASRGYSRLHLLCGESTCSVASRFLRMGTTALVVALIEAGCRPGHDVRLRHPLTAMQAFAADPELRASAELAMGGRMTALQIQRHYLNAAREQQHAGFMPEWTEAVCDVWEQMLDRLAQGPQAVSSTLDWAIKLALYRDHSEQRGVEWGQWKTWNGIIREIAQGLLGATLDHDAEPVRVDALIKPSAPQDLRDLAQGIVARHQKSLDTLEDVLRLRQELFELDTRFGQLNGSGIFSQLEAAGVLDHQVPGVDNVEHAIENPPQNGRARIRGQVIRRVWGRQGFVAEWSGVWDTPNHKYLDLTDPFVATEEWKDEPQTPLPQNPLLVQAAVILREVLRQYDRGDYVLANSTWSQLTPVASQLRGTERKNYLRYGAWVSARRGYLDGIHLLDELAREHPVNASLICDYMSVWRYRGLVPPQDVQVWIDRGQALVHSRTDPDPGGTACFLGHVAYTLSRWGRPGEALTNVELGMRGARYLSTHPHTRSRLHAERGEALRMLGRGSDAAESLREAGQICHDHQFEGDYADFTLTYEAKLYGQQEPGRAYELLERARDTQVAYNNRLGEARTLLLQARLPRRMWASRKAAWLERTLVRITQLKTECPALANCPRMASVLNQWKEWTTGVMPAGMTDYYWLV